MLQPFSIPLELQIYYVQFYKCFSISCPQIILKTVLMLPGEAHFCSPCLDIQSSSMPAHPSSGKSIKKVFMCKGFDELTVPGVSIHCSHSLESLDVLFGSSVPPRVEVGGFWIAFPGDIKKQAGQLNETTSQIDGRITNKKLRKALEKMPELWFFSSMWCNWSPV